MSIFEIVLSKVSHNLRAGTYEQVGTSISLPIALLSEQIRLKGYETWDPLSVIMILDFIYSAAWLARSENGDVNHDKADKYFCLAESEQALSSLLELREEYENFIVFTGYETQEESSSFVSEVIQGNETLNVMNSAFKLIIRSVTRDLNMYFSKNTFTTPVQETRKRILKLINTSRNPLLLRALSAWESKRFPVFENCTDYVENLALNKISILKGQKDERIKIFEEDSTLKLCSFFKDETENQSHSIDETESKAAIVRILLCLLPRSVWVYGMDPDYSIISIAADLQENNERMDRSRGDWAKKKQEYLIPVEGGIIITNLQFRRILLSCLITVSVFFSCWTVHKRDEKDVVTFVAESIEITGALLAIFFIIIKIVVEDDRAVINCFRAREKVVTDKRLKKLLKENNIRDLKALYAGKSKVTSQIFRARNFSVCLHPATDEGISSETKLFLKDLRRWHFSFFGAILVTPDNKVGVLDVCNDENCTTTTLPDHYVSYDLYHMSGRISRNRLHENILLR